MAEKIIVSLSYVLIMLGSVGMILFATKFPFSTRIQDLTLSERRLFGLNGFHFWIVSWGSIIMGTLIQLIHYWMSLSSKTELIIKF